MPLIDLPLEQLKTYAGRSPRPADFDAYWSAALAEMRAVPRAIEITPASFQTSFATCQHLTFTGVGGARIHAKLLTPTAPPRGSAVLFFHGYTGQSHPWYELLPYVAQGHFVAALDCRGQAGLSEDTSTVRGHTHNGHIIRGLAEGPENLLYRSIFLDTAQLASICLSFPGVDPARVGVTGGSQGGALALACAALEPRIARCAPAFPFLSDYQRVWEMDQARDAYLELRWFFRHIDPLHANEAEWFRRLGYIDVQNLASRIRASVLFACGLMDTVCPPSTQFAAYNKLTCPKEMVLYPDYAHEALPEWNERVFSFMASL